MAQKFTVPITIKNLTSSGSDGVTVFLDQENYARLKLEAGGRIVWGDGTGAGDTNLYRSAANVLKTDDVFQAVAGVITLSTSGSPSVSLDDGALAVDTTNNKFYFRSNGAWNQVTGGGGGGGATVTVSDTEPVGPSEGDLWFESDTGGLFIYYDSVWLEIGGGTAFDSTAQYIEAKGDLLVGYGSASVENLSVGPNGYFLKANSSASLGVEWASIPTINALDDIGDVSASSPGSGDFLKWNGSAWVNDAINLGTDTVGNYVSDVTAGTGVSITHTPGEGSSAQVGIGQDVDISASVTFAHVSAGLTGNVTGNASTASALQTARTISLAGDVSGSVSFDGSQNVTITSAVQPNSVALGTDTTGNYVADVSGGTGVTVSHIAGEGTTPTVSIGQDVATSASVTFAHVSAPVTGTLTGSVIGNADTATALDTARIISLNGDVSGSVSFDGTSDVSISAVIEPNSVALGTDTTGNYVSDVTAGTGVTVTHTPGEGSSPTIAIGQAVGTSSSVTFAHVSSDVTGDLTGNADTATALQTARTIELSGDVSGSATFDGTSNINISTTVNTASVSIGELYGVNITNPQEFQTLEYNGTEWVNEYSSLVSYVRNAESTTITTGTAVYLFGATGDHATVKRADNTTDVTSSKTVGLAGANIAASQNGPIITRGYVNGINLSAYNPGDILWLGKNGQFTTTKPSAPDHLVFIGVVVRATNNGIVYVATQNGYELEELHDVKITGATDGQFLRYNSASTVWVNDAINLGTDTVGNYVADVSGGTGVTVSHIPAEGSTPTVSIGQDVATSASVTFAHLIVQGDMEVQGTITRLNETNLDVDEAFIYLNANSASANPDMGVAFNYNDGSYKHAGIFRDASDSIFKIFDGYVPEPQTPIDTSHGTYNDATFQAKSVILTQTNGTAPLSVSSSTAVTNLNADYLDGQHGSYYAPINNPTFTGTVSLPNNTVALGTQTTGNYVADVSSGTGITVTHTPGEGTTPSVAINTATVPLLASANTFSTNQIIEGSSTSALLRITQTGTGNALLIEDETNPDLTPLVITATGEFVHGHTAVEGEWYISSGNSHTFHIVDNDSTNTVGGNAWIGRYNGAAGFTIARSNGTNIGDRGTLVAGDIIGGITWAADDGISASYNRAGQISVVAEGTLSTGVTPTRMVFSTGNTTGLDTERMRIDSSGAVSIGGSAVAGRSLVIPKNITGATTSIAVVSNGVVQSDVTTEANAFRSTIATAASAFTLTVLQHFVAAPQTFGAGSTVTSQFGFNASSLLTGATNNYGFFGDIASATGRWNLYMNGTAANYMLGRLGVGATLTSGAMAQITNTTAADKAFVVKGAASQSGTLFEAQNSAASALFVIDSSGQVGISTTPSAGRSLTVSKPITGATTSFGIVMNGTVQSDVTTAVQGIRSAMATAAASFTLGLAYSFYAGQGTVGAGSSITTAIGYIADSSLTAATNNYGFYGDIASGTGRWNLYMNGTAANYLAGRLGVGATNTTGAMVAITNTTAADDAFLIKGASSQSGYLTEWQNSSATTLAYVDSSGNAKFVSIDGGSA